MPQKLSKDFQMDHTVAPNWIRQQRRSTFMPRKRTIISETECSENRTRQDSKLSTTSDKSEHGQFSWYENVRRKTMVSSTKEKLIRESEFSPDLRGIYSIRFVPDGERPIVSYGSGAIQLWQPEGKESPTTIKGSPEHGFPIICMRFLPSKYSEHFFAGGGDGNIFFSSLKPGDYKMYAKGETKNEINALDLSLHGCTLVSGGKDAVLRLYDFATGKLKGTFERTLNDVQSPKFHNMRIFAVKFHHSINEVFLTGGWDDCVKIWDIRVKDGRVRDIPGPHICGDALDVRNDTVLTGSWVVKQSLQTWDFNSGRLIENITPVNRPFNVDGEFLYCAQFLANDPTGETVLTGGSGVGKVEITNINEKKVVNSFKVQKTVQAIDTCNDYAAFGGMESVIRIVSIE